MRVLQRENCHECYIESQKSKKENGNPYRSCTRRSRSGCQYTAHATIHSTVSAIPGARRTLAAAGLTGLFDVILTPEDVEHGKPAPDMFLLAAERLGAAPSRCVVFEDAVPGIAAAAAAGMDCVRVRRPSLS